MARSALTVVLTALVALSTPYAGATAPPDALRVVIGFTHASYAQAGEVESAVGAVEVARIPQLRADVVEVAGQASDVLERLRADDAVRFAQLDGAVHALRVPNDEFLSTQWSIRKTRAEPAWDLTTGSPRVVVAVVDTGVDATQPDLGGKLVAGYDYVNNDTDPSDDNGHGTAVAGIIGAKTDNTIGVAGYCWECRLMPVKVLGADGSGFESALAQGMVWAVDHGAQVVNLSLGGSASEAVVAAAAQYAAARGTLVVAAAGNESLLSPDYPAALPNVLSVAASDENDRLYSFSNSGALLAAPGENSTVGRGNYVSFLGTSSAAPVVSGIAGLAFSLVPTATPAVVTQALEATAVPVPGIVDGRVDAYAALRALAPAAPAPAAPAASPGDTGAGAPTRIRKVLARTVSRAKPVRLAFDSGRGAIDVGVELRVRAAVRLRLLRGGRTIAGARGAGRASVHVDAAQGVYTAVVTTASRRRRRLALTVSYPSR